MFNFKSLLKTIIIPLGLGIIISIILKDTFNYNNLVKPSFAPPQILFPIVWTILYILMGISYYILKVNNKETSNVRDIYYTQLVFNLLWPILFFGFKARLLALICIIILLYLVIKMIVIFYKENKLAGLLQIPYLLWIIFATILNYSAYILNR